MIQPALASVLSHGTPHALRRPMPNIVEGSSVVTVIEVFDVEPRAQVDLVAVLERANVEIFQFLEGFVSASLHRGVDGRHVASYAQWSTVDAYNAAIVHPHVEAHRKSLSAFPHPAPALYHVAAICER